MIMLSRVAERVYWMARYIERAEDTARLVAAYNHLVMDIPRGSQPGWEILVRILNSDPVFDQWFNVRNEQNVLRLLIGEADAECSIPYAVKSARENVRTTRDVLPDEVWELVNELYLYTSEASESSVGRRNRQQYLEQVIQRCQVINGVLRSTLCRDHSYRFIKLGQLLERADMTTRIIDVGASDFLERDGAAQGIEHLLWGTLLKSMSALGAYRRMIGPQVEKNAAVNFVFMEQTFPRSVRFCIRGIREELGPLTNKEGALRVVERTRRKLSGFDSTDLDQEALHKYIDELQLIISDLHQAVQSSWFHRDG
ncbi:alpha-E domain-containing protein [Congregibacter variabilis]|uniref:Alpha-E domain-containing protein n=1 Tax=Congregibacter variabilis TaxID=3081200 RepID=A0ABZ0I1Y9_9GAMM|nr:alpha-E domain-containing protein [Congregibacter sp. IMCC43200]